MNSNYRSIREQAFEANRAIPGYGLALLTWGNVSAFDSQRGVFAIKPSGVPYAELTPDSMVVVDLEGQIVEGKLRPSSDTPTHRFLYRSFAGIGGIVHTHSTYATAWSQCLEDLPVWGTTHADHSPFAIPCTPLLSKRQVEGDYEWETGQLIVDCFAQLEPPREPLVTPMVLVGGHAPFTWGATAQSALQNAVVLEEIAKMAIMTRIASGGKPLAGLPPHLITKHYERKHGPRAYYGQK